MSHRVSNRKNVPKGMPSEQEPAERCDTTVSRYVRHGPRDMVLKYETKRSLHMIPLGSLC